MKMLKPCNFRFKKAFYLTLSCALFTSLSYGVEVKPDATEKIRDDAQVFQGEKKEEKKRESISMTGWQDRPV
jgi:hypothetical protein